MQILHRFTGSLPQYLTEVYDPDRYRPDRCPQCEAPRTLRGHGFYRRTLVDVDFDGLIPVRRYLCGGCKRTVSLLPELALPYLRFSISVISLFLVARLLEGRTLLAAAAVASQPTMPYQRGQFWIRRLQRQAAALGAALVALTTPITAPNFVIKALRMLQSVGWIAAHRFLFSRLRLHLLGWPAFLAPHGPHGARPDYTHLPVAGVGPAVFFARHLLAGKSHKRGLIEHAEQESAYSYIFKGRKQRGVALESIPQPWLTAHYHPGDLLIFHNLMIHWSLPNRSDRIRLSIDNRCQPAAASRTWQAEMPILEARRIRETAKKNCGRRGSERGIT